MAFKFEQLDVWERSLDYIDQIHKIADELPKHKRYESRTAVGGRRFAVVQALLNDSRKESG